MNDVPSNIVAIVGIVVLGLIAGVALWKDINHGLLQLCIMAIAGLAGYKIKGMVDEQALKELEKVRALKPPTGT